MERLPTKMPLTTLKIASFICWLFLGIGAHGESFQYEEGTHYVALEIPIKTKSPDVVEVTEYFSYGCPHCYRFDPEIQQWRENLPNNVVFDRSPAIWGGYEVYARTYYTVLALGVLEKVHTPLFHALHAERRSINDLKAMTAFMQEQGIEPELFVKTFSDSFGVKAMYQQAIGRQRVYRSGGVPAIIVNGKYRVEGSMVENSNAAMLAVASFLVEKERLLLSDGEADLMPVVETPSEDHEDGQ
jgi:protein dithiol oxidoreductase (disulfide-forming)